ncbi:autotransporter assembly complex protein TamA [Roseisalinus antarcticus]|uniref:Translocation and assembly module TamA n=1 Tax=Roseisalinus antarcticus TaxID=254357 RepID=A0A1Y5SY44_9RHOB|nr:autotransporter assembly complex family protein [Roseisalinus antarcticus]SLN51403.1 Translocation and assembly module TamA precursor [Roseisalinus antarcticus]
MSLDAADASDTLDSELRQASLLITLDDQDTPTPQDYIAAAQADYRRLLTALYSAGYYGGTVSIRIDGREAAGIPPVGAPGQITQIEILVERGPLFSFGRASLAPLPEGTVLPEGFRSGERARSDTIRAAVRAGVVSWREQGYARAAPAGEDITARHADEELDVSIGITPGPLLSFGPLVVSGNQAVRAERIAEIAGLPVGERFSPDAVETSTMRLRRTGAFSSVVLREAEEDGPGNTLPILADIAEQKPRRFGFGIELSSIDGLTVSAFWLHRNLFGGAERFRIEGEIQQISDNVDGIDYGINASFGRPATFGPDQDLYVNLELLDSQDDLIEIFALQTELGLSRIVTETLTISGGLGYRYAEVKTEFGDTTYQLITFPLSAEWDRRDNELNPRSGFYINAEAIPFLGLDNAENGARLTTDTRYYRSFGAEDRVTVAGRLQFGSLLGTSGFDAPADYLFLSGGGGTVRGQEYQSLGIMRDGFEVGGNSFLGAQIEARVGITDAISGVAFYDYGQVGADQFPSEDDESHAGAGVGIRYDTGIGPIRLDIATPASGDDAGQAVQVYIGIGQAF